MKMIAFLRLSLLISTLLSQNLLYSNESSKSSEICQDIQKDKETSVNDTSVNDTSVPGEPVKETSLKEIQVIEKETTNFKLKPKTMVYIIAGVFVIAKFDLITNTSKLYFWSSEKAKKAKTWVKENYNYFAKYHEQKPSDENSFNSFKSNIDDLLMQAKISKEMSDNLSNTTRIYFETEGKVFYKNIEKYGFIDLPWYDDNYFKQQSYKPINRMDLKQWENLVEKEFCRLPSNYESKRNYRWQNYLKELPATFSKTPKIYGAAILKGVGKIKKLFKKRETNE